MRFGEKLAVHINPLILRLALGSIFLFAGLEKLTQTMTVQGEDAAILANMGVDLSKPATEDPGPADTQPPQQTAEQTALGPAAAFAFLPTSYQDDEQDGEEAQPNPAESEQELAPTPTTPAPQFSAAEFTEPREVKKLYGIALTLHAGANPQGTRPDGSPQPPMVPAWTAKGSTAKILAWVAALTEAIFGGFLIIGLFSRIGGLAIAGTMITAMWLTQFGPAWQAGTLTGLGFGPGFLPNNEYFNFYDWVTFFFQLILLAAATSILFAGSGALALDRLLFGKPRKHRDDDDEDDDD
ncbi:MAG: DoxX family membrane protein [Planctomycetota bacterium]